MQRLPLAQHCRLLPMMLPLSFGESDDVACHFRDYMDQSTNISGKRQFLGWPYVHHLSTHSNSKGCSSLTTSALEIATITVTHRPASYRSCVSWAYLIGLHLMGVHLHGCASHGRASHGRASHGRASHGRLGRQAADHPRSALRVVKASEKTAQRPRCCRSQRSSSASKRYQSSLSKLSIEGGWARRGKEAQAIGLASQSDRQKSDRQTG